MRSQDSISSLLATKGSEIFSVEPSATVYLAIEMMAAHRVGALLVMDQGKLVGIISERDYCRRLILKDRASHTTPVEAIMASPVITVTPDHTVEDCLRLMSKKHIRHLPVMQDRAVVGVVTIGDLVHWIVTPAPQAAST